MALADEVPAEDDTRTKGSRRQLALRIALLLFGLVSLYVFAPQLAQVYGEIDVIARIDLWWLLAIVGLQGLSFFCMWVLQRLALRTEQWFSVATSQLAGNAFSRVVPAGAAAGVALQFQMLASSGVNATTAASSLTTVSLLTTGSVLVLPVFALPSMLAGAPVPEGLASAAWLGLIAFLLLAGLGWAALGADRPICWTGRTFQRIRNRLRPNTPPLEGFDQLLLEERDLVRGTLGERKWQATFATGGRVLFDYLSLLACLAALGDDAQPSLVLLAYVAASVLAMIPITPGGLGFVEAGLTGTLTLAGASAGDALIATALYRLASFWMPMPIGLVAWALFKLRLRATRARGATA
ncbi:MAG TPA: lysylphosphatidylglycerol synthase transmembrane domain-containing protein [Acidimicrobiales bacterium]|nr:lysylphosphatidylglycerol synthase transmembrane domain-containing protein [Acidimicrobiales bacterium]